MPFIAGAIKFLSPILGPIIQMVIGPMLDRLEQRIMSGIGRKEDFERIDAKKLELVEEMAQASTQEERDAALDKYKNFRPDFGAGNGN